MSLLIEWVKSRPGYLCLDDVVVEKPFSKSIPYVGWTYSTSLRRKVLGMHIVILFWSDGKYRIPISFRIWRPKKDCPKGGYKTKIDLALEIVGEAMSKGLKPQYIVFDCWYNSRRFTKALRRLGLVWVSVLKSNVRVRHRRRLRRASRLGSRLKEERKGLRVYLPRYGKVKLVIVRNGDKKEYLVTNALRASPEMVILRKSSRWDAEESFREAKQLAGLGACQSRVPQAVERHAALALLTLVVLQLLKSDPSETMGQVKERLQLQVLAGAPALTLA
jgi:SRSO17 transposase